MSKPRIIEATVLDIKTKKGSRDLLSSINISKDWRPILIRTNYYSFFKCLEENANSPQPCICTVSDHDKCIEKIKSTKKMIANSNAYNFLENSSVWIRFCDNEDWDGKEGSSSEPQVVKDALEEFHWFHELGLYDIKPAKEYIDYHFRAQKENFLKDLGHGVFVSPMIYSDEVKFRHYFIDSDISEIQFKYNNNEKNGFLSKDIALRILLVDDKIWGETNDYCTNIRVSKCENCETCTKTADYCKLKIIKNLLNGNFILNPNKQAIFKEKTYWADCVESVVIDRIRVSQIWKIGNGDILVPEEIEISKLNNMLNSQNEQTSKNVQIVGVRDLETALTLMSCCKFDIILLDYLLGKRNSIEIERTYSTELFEFLCYDFKKVEVPAVIDMLKKGNSEFDNKFFKKFQDNVKLNRGPLDKFWIIPMTSYNSSFISDLQRKHVRLIDHRWNISQGADPINTPWKFLHKINEFIDLQLRSCVFHMEQLLRFLKYTCEDTIDINKEKEGKLTFYDFQSFMGAEYTNFMRRYGNRHLIQRDAIWDKSEPNIENKSVFASYIWNRFYANPNYRVVIELNRLMQRFFHQASTMHNDRNGQQRLEETFGQLCFFIDTNKMIQDCINDKNNGLTEGLEFSLGMTELRGFMDKLMAHSDDQEQQKDNPL